MPQKPRESTKGASQPVFDLVLLGMGDDGHTASLLPGSPALAEQERHVLAVRAPVQPPSRLTLTFPVLDRTDQVHFLVTGAEKAEALRCALHQPADPQRCPAAAVQPSSSRLFWWVDKEAAALI